MTIRPRQLTEDDFYLGRKLVCLVDSERWTYGKVYHVVRVDIDSAPRIVGIEWDLDGYYPWHASSLTSNEIFIMYAGIEDLDDEDLFLLALST